MAGFMKVKYENPKLRQSELANQLGLSSSTLQRYRNDIIMLSPYRIQPNNANKRMKKVRNTKFNNDSHHEFEVKRLQMTSIGLKTSQTKSNKKKQKCAKSRICAREY